MKKRWLYRSLLTYIPIFFFVVLVLTFLFYLTIDAHAKRQIERTNELFAEQMLLVVDSTLKTAEQTIVGQLVYNEILRGFFTEQNPLPPYEMSKVSRELNNIFSILSSIHSIYLYNPSTGQVLSQSFLCDLSDFTDNAFIHQIMQQDQVPTWTNPRIYNEFTGDFRSDQVVSMVKKAPINVQPSGLLVVNMRVGAILSMLEENVKSGIHYADLLDASRKPILIENRPAPNRQVSHVASEATSRYTGWTIVTGIEAQYVSTFFSSISVMSIAMGTAVVLIGLLLLTYMTHKHYKPIDAIVRRTQSYALKWPSKAEEQPSRRDEFELIQTVLDELEHKSSRLEVLHREDLKYRRKQFFLDLLQGERTIELQEWQAELERLGLQSDFQCIMVTAAEIDQFAKFSDRYSPRDQALLKFAVSNVFSEIAARKQAVIWCEWTETNTLASMLLLNDADSSDNAAFVVDLCREALVWVNDHLSFTITIGVGKATSDINELVEGYEEAKEAVKYKAVLGNNRVIVPWDLPSGSSAVVFSYLNTIHDIALALRLGEQGWRQQLEQLFAELRKGLFLRQDITNLLSYLIHCLEKQMKELPYEWTEPFLQVTLPGLEQLLAEAETVDELQSGLAVQLSELHSVFDELREKRSSHRLLDEVKAHIKANFANPDLSLNLLSDAFGMSPRYVSKLFKEQFGGKFIDYMVHIRIEEAKRLLETTDEPVQRISENVGYLHVLSFIRAFKKVTGTTPGDYRKSQS